MRAKVGLLFAACALGALVAPAAAVAQPQPPARAPRPGEVPRAPARETLAELERLLDRAADRVSLPRPALMGQGSARGYRLPGYGIVVVLAPRTLPGADGGLDVLRPRHRVELRSARPRAEGEAPEPVEALERQVIVLQHETERARRAAEEDMERIVRELRVRVAPDGSRHLEVRSEQAEVPLEPESQPAPVRPVAPVAGAAATPPQPPAAPAPPAPPPAPPWKFWFESAAPYDSRPAEAIVADVRQSILATLETSPGRLGGLRPEEFVTVAVDFEPAGLFRQRAAAERTLVVRARVRDLEARARGSLAPEELRKRIEVIEY